MPDVLKLRDVPERSDSAFEVGVFILAKVVILKYVLVETKYKLE